MFAWCGGAVLLRRGYLDDVGLFDERLFLYYEDTDLSWRGRLRGWRYVYVPASVVRHRHAQSSGVGSPMFRYYTERNRLLVLAKNAPARLALAGDPRRGQAAGGHVPPSGRAATVDAPPAGARRGRPPVARRAQLPPAAPGDAARPAGRRARRWTAASLLSWMVTK